MQKTKSPVSADNKANKFSYLTIAKLTYIYTSHPREAGQTSFQLPESEWPTTQMRNVGDVGGSGGDDAGLGKNSKIVSNSSGKIK